MRILFVDDTTYAMKYYVQALRDAKIVVELRSSIEDALKLFRASDDWNGAIVDVMFDTVEPPAEYLARDPQGNSAGLYLAEDLRKIKSDIRIIALTNLPERPAAKALEGMRNVCVIDKKISPLDLRDKVLDFFSGT